MSRYAFRIYQASPGDKQLTALNKKGERRPVSLATDVVNHSPTGFGFGFHGSGPAQTALSARSNLIRSKLFGTSLIR